MFFIGAYQGTQATLIQEDHSGVSVAERDDLKPLGDPVRAYSLTLVIKHLVLQIFCAKLDPSIGHFYVRDFSAVSSQIAVSSDAVEWPLRYVLGDATLDMFIHRWSETPPPS